MTEQLLRTMDGYTLEDVVKYVITTLKPEEVEQVEAFEGLVPEGTVKEYRDIDGYPPMMSAKHVKEYLGISEAFAYEVLNSANCPTIRMGKRMVVSKESFLQFLKDSEGKQIF